MENKNVWDHKLREQIIDLISKLERCQTKDGRIALLQRIGLKKTNFGWVDETSVFATRLIGHLDKISETNSENYQKLITLIDYLLDDEEEFLSEEDRTRFLNQQRNFEELISADDNAQRLFKAQINDIINSPLPKTAPEKLSYVSHDILGWTHISLASISRPYSDEDLYAFFDGAQPEWPEIVSGKIEKRQIVDKTLIPILTEQLNTGRGVQVTIVRGASSEGKTTILMQTIHQILQDFPNLYVLWHTDRYQPFPEELPIEFIEQSNLLIVSEHSDKLIQNLAGIVSRYKQLGVKVQILLSMHTGDWEHFREDRQRLKEAVGRNWRDYPIESLDETDAARILVGWQRTADLDRGLGKLKTVVEQKGLIYAAQLLVKLAHDERIYGEGTFFGALLQARIKVEDLHERLKTLLSRLENKQIASVNLSEALLCIAAMHDVYIYNKREDRSLYILTRKVLARYFNIDVKPLEREVLRSLSGEANSVFTDNGTVLLTRHRIIAKAIITIITEQRSNSSLLNTIYPYLVRAAELEYKDSGDVGLSMAYWNNVADYFLNRGKSINNHQEKVRNIQLACAIASTHLDTLKSNEYLFVKLARILRESARELKQAQYIQQARELFTIHSNPVMTSPKPPKYTVPHDRAYYYEWATTEGVAGNILLDIWLSAISIVDSSNMPSSDFKPLDLERAKARERKEILDRVEMSLNGLAQAFAKLASVEQETDKLLFANACIGASELAYLLEKIEISASGEKYKLLSRSVRGLERAYENIKNYQLPKQNPKQSLIYIEMGINVVHKRLQNPFFPTGLYNEKLSFTEITNLLNIR